MKLTIALSLLLPFLQLLGAVNQSHLTGTTGNVQTNINARLPASGGTGTNETFLGTTTISDLVVTNGTGPWVLKAGDTMTGPLVIGGDTVTASTPILNLSQTWNNGAVVFHALQVEATTTANAAGSTLLRLRANGSTVASVSNGGTLTCSGNGTFTTGTLTLGTTVLLQDVSVNTLALRNSANAQTFNVYGTYTDASNYRRLRSTMTTGGAVTIAAEGLGTGATGNILDLSVNGVNRISVSSGGTISLTGTVLFAFSSAIGWSSRTYITSPAVGEYLFQDNTLGNVDIFLKLGVNTSAAAGIKRVGTELRARLNDDSGFATIQGKLRTDNAYVAGAPGAATGTVTITDSTGTTYRVPVLP